jgi:hypothetical protein
MEPVQLIREYIHAKKGVWVDIAEPDTDLRWELFWRAYMVAAAWAAWKANT